MTFFVASVENLNLISRGASYPYFITKPQPCPFLFCSFMFSNKKISTGLYGDIAARQFIEPLCIPCVDITADPRNGHARWRSREAHSYSSTSAPKCIWNDDV